MSDMTVEPEERPVSLVPLWAGILGPPAAWAAQLLVSYSAEEVACSPGHVGDAVWGISVNALGIVATVIAVLLTVGAGWYSWRARARLGDASSSAAVDRSRFMCLLGIFSTAYFLLVILLTAIGPAGIPSCR